MASETRSQSQLRRSFHSAACRTHARKIAAHPGDRQTPGYLIGMLTKPILAILLAACGVNSSGATTEPPPEQPDKKPPDETGHEQHFCCAQVNLEKKSGDDCVPISEAQILACGEILYCSGDWGKSNGVTKCLD
jgi:hypothetical protein